MKKTLNQKGLAPVLILLAALGVIVFLLVSNTFDFKDKLFSGLFPKPSSYAAGTYYGNAVSTFNLFGQKSIGGATKNQVSSDGMYHSSGVIVDKSSNPNKIYIVDSGNSRILGFNGLGGTGPVTPSVVIGQPDFSSGNCNGDDNLGFNKAPTASTLCLLQYPLGTNTAEQWGRYNIDVDSTGNLYVVDAYNNRVLEYFQPFSTDKSGGKGDSVADVVYGQDDFTSNGPNRATSQYQGDNTKPLDNSLHTSISSTLGHNEGTGWGVSVDGTNNVWVADRYNNRVLRFPQGQPGQPSTHANLAIGQADLQSSGCDDSGTSLSRLCQPIVARVNPDTGDLYVLDNYPSPFKARILAFHAPFTTGMSAYKMIVPQQTALFTNWGGLFGDGKEIFQSTGFNFNPDKTDYPTGLMWVNEHSDNRVALIDSDGNVLKFIGAKSETERGGDQEYLGVCGGIENGNHLWWPGGSIGFDSANNMYLADEVYNTVYRYALPYNLKTNGCLPDANGVLVTKSANGNHPTADTLGEASGMTVFQNQLIVQDQGNTRKVWNDYTNVGIGSSASIVMTGGMPPETLMSSAVDDSNRLWGKGEQGEIRVQQLPFQSSTDQRVVGDNIQLYWADDHSRVTISNLGGMAFDKVGHKMYFVDAGGTRILRVSNYNDFATGQLLVDLVIGQTDKNNVKCNQGLSSPAANTLCQAYQIKFDNLGNLYVVDNLYECHGNDRITVFTATDLGSASGIFPDLSAKQVLVASDFTHSGPCAYNTVNQPGSPISVAFNSLNQMVVGNDGYYGDPSQRQIKQLWFYASPLTKTTPDASINLYMGAPGELTFDSNDNLLIQDKTWYRVSMINLCTDPGWLSWLPGVNSISTCGVPTVTQVPRITSVPANTPTPTAAPTPSVFPTPTPGGPAPCTAPGPWTYCSSEFTTCSFPGGSTTVRFGADPNSYTCKVVSSPTECGNNVFGDPAVGTLKHCDYSTAVPTPTPTTVPLPTPTRVPTPTTAPTAIPTVTPVPTKVPTPTPAGDTKAPTVPTNLLASAVSSSQINLSWSASSDNVAVTGYKIFRNNVQVAQVTGTSYGDANLAASTTYSYFVIAFDAAGNQSAASATVSATTQAVVISVGNLKGTVYSSKAASLSGAKVSLVVSGGTKSVNTNSSGAYAFSGLPQGVYAATYQASSYITQRINIVITANQTTTQNVALVKSR